MRCIHSIYILKIRDDFDTIYKAMDKFLSDGYAVIYALEAEEEERRQQGGGGDNNNNNNNNTLENRQRRQFVNHVYSKIKQSRLIGDVEHHMETGALRIIDIREIYSADRINDDSKVLLRRWMSIIRDVRRKGNFKGIVIMSGGRATAFSDSTNQDKLIAYEQAITHAAAKLGSIRIICCYPQESVDKMQFAQLASIVNAHECSALTIGNNMEFRKMDSSNIILDAILEGVEDVMGEGSGKLIIKTMKVVYKINEDTIVSNPSLFQEKLQKILGNMISPKVLDSIRRRIKESTILAGLVIMITGYYWCTHSINML